jgi:endonuclease-3 related protein
MRWQAKKPMDRQGARSSAGCKAGGPPLGAYLERLEQRLGKQQWWPARTRFEVMVGAILTQSTSWANVELAIRNLRRAHALTAKAIRAVPAAKLARLVRPSGYYRQKAKKLKALVEFLDVQYGFSPGRMFRTPEVELREELLGIHGIGPETADAILLYAGDKPSFVVDAYTRRVLERHGWVRPADGYAEVKNLCEENLPMGAKTYNEFHALIVETGKRWCRRGEARCWECPLESFLKEGL